MRAHTPSATRARRLISLFASFAVVAALTSGCSEIAEWIPGQATEAATPLEVPQDQQDLARFYEQRLDWVSCGQGECAELTVPVDYADPEGETIEISVLKMPTRSARDRVGSIVVNPGGPGGSGVDYATAADVIVGPQVRQRFDIVGFDPRGVGRSAPIDCLSDVEMDEYVSLSVASESGEGHGPATADEDFVQGCATNAGSLLKHVSTMDVAKDLDVLRAALGEEQLNYLGKSYGSYLGAVFAEQFPDRVGRFVLDGALPPDLGPDELTIGQAVGFERASQAWAQDCVEEGSCPLGSSADEVVQGLADLLNRLSTDPVPVRGDARVEELNDSWAFFGIIRPMYDQGMWSMLTEALRDVVDRDDGTALMELANGYLERSPNGVYLGNLIESNLVINCLDRGGSADPAALEAQAEQAAPVWGALMTGESSPCEIWPTEPVGGVRTITAAGSAPIVVVGTTRDPATPYEWSKRLADQLQSGVLVSFDGDGHTAYMRSNECVNGAIDAFYVDGTVPEDGLEC